MKYQHDIDRAFEALTFIARHTDPRKKCGLASMSTVARLQFIARPVNGKMEKVNETAKAILDRVDTLKARGTIKADRENMRAVLQMVNTLKSLTDGLLLLAQDKKPSHVFYNTLAAVEVERDIALTLQNNVMPAVIAAHSAAKKGPVRRLIARIMPGRRAQNG
jgi:hypothetical protein